MTTRTRIVLLFASLAFVLAACGTAAGAPVSPTPDPSEPAAPAEPTATPDGAPDERDVDGVITVAEGMAFSGPGGTIAEALANGSTTDLPTLVNGVLFRDTDGQIYLATSVSDEATPTFDGPMLLVLNLDNTGDSWDMANAELLGLEEANGIVFNRNAQILGFLEVK